MTKAAVDQMRDTVYDLPDLLEHFLANCQGTGLASRTIGTYQERLQHFFRWFEAKYGALPTTRDFRDTTTTQPVVAAYLAAYRAAGAGVGTRNLARSALVMFARWLVEQTYTYEEGVSRVKRARAPQVALYALDHDQLATIEAAIDTASPAGYRDLALWRFMLDTGCRLAEVCHLTLADVELDTRSGRPLTAGQALISGKGSKERKVGFGNLTTRTLRAYRDGVRRPSPDAHQDPEYFFLTTAGLRLLDRGLYAMIRRLGQRAGIPLHPHLLRHTFATHYLRAGGNLTDLQAHMGHATPQQTLHYTHLIMAEANTQVQQTRSLIDARDAKALGEPALGQLVRVRRTDLRANQAQNGTRRRVS